MTKRSKKLINFLAVLMFIVILAFMYGWPNIWKLGFGNADLGAVNFETFTPSKKPNHALFCPENFCKNAAPNKVLPTYDLNVADLKIKLLKLVQAEKNIYKVAENVETYEYRFVQYTPLMGFPDTIRIKFIDLGNNKSSMAIFSESQIGQSDLGVNYKRINMWLKQLDTTN